MFADPQHHRHAANQRSGDCVTAFCSRLDERDDKQQVTPALDLRTHFLAAGPQETETNAQTQYLLDLKALRELGHIIDNSRGNLALLAAI